jgi:hypothetical protein
LRRGNELTDSLNLVEELDRAVDRNVDDVACHRRSLRYRLRRGEKAMMVSLLLALVQAAPTAAQPAPAAQQGQVAAENPFYASLRQRGVSAAGVQQLAQLDARLAPERQRIDAGLTALNQEIASIVGAQAVDLARLSNALTRRNALLAERASRSSAALLEYLQALSPADRQIAVRSVGLPSTSP